MIALHEEHGEVVASWARLGYRHESVICFDRHLDLKPLNPDAARRLGEARSPDELAGLNRRLPLREMPGSYGLDDFYAAGGELGLVSDMTWVTASDGPDSPERRRRLLAQVSTIKGERETLHLTRFGAQGQLATRLCGIELTVTSPSAFAVHGPPPDARVDVDLDWFADLQGGPSHQPRDLFDLLESHGLQKRVDTVTYSIRSGFLPPDMRYLADSLSAWFSAELQTSHRDALPLPEETFRAIRHGTVPTPDVLDSELTSLGAVGTVLHGLVLLSTGNIDGAGVSWIAAAEQGSVSTWLAYGLGLHHYRADDLLVARQWFARASAGGFDPLEAKSRLLGSLCDLRTGSPEQAYQEILAFAQVFPLHQGATLLALDLAGSLSLQAPDFLHEQYATHSALINGR